MRQPRYKFESDAQQDEYWKRVARLVLRPRSMSMRAAQTVIDAAMFGRGCVEGTVRARIQEAFDRTVEKNKDLLRRLDD